MGKWRNIPPSKRANWNKLTEGQRRYAEEQYKLALLRRGLPIDHPVPEPDEPDPHGRGSDSDDSYGFLDRPHPDEHRVAEEVNRHAEQEEADRQVIEAFDEGLFEGDIEGGSGESSGHSNIKTVGAMNAGTSRMDVDNPNTGKRTADPGGDRDSNVNKRKRLPGTGGDQNAKAAMEGGPRDVALPHPTVSIHSHVRWYRKVHRVFSYGVAYKLLEKVINPTPPTNPEMFTLQIITTPLMEVPWDRRFYYLNPSEFALLPEGSSFNKCRIQVLQRNVRVAFPTNSTDNNLATLNQNKNIITAVGLYHKLNAIPIRYAGFEANQPMIPSDFNLVGGTAYDNLVRDMYGPPDTAAEFKTVVPRHQMGIPQLYPIYAALANANPQGATAEVAGWETLQKHYKEVDADASTGNCILEMEYHPFVGLCKVPQKPIYRGPALRNSNLTITVPRGSHTLVPHETTLTFPNRNESRPNTITENHEANTRQVTAFTHTGYIEQSQFLYQGIYKHEDVKAQKAVHIGVQPTPALTTRALVNDQTNNAFTDTQAYFEIIAEAEINTAYPTFRPLANFVNVKEGDQWLESNKTRFWGLGLYDGLLTARP